MSREIFVVARDRPDLYRYLSQTFADADNVQVILDRRSSERSEGEDAESDERRQAERRARPNVERDLRSVGYAFITIP
jgi:hypothetical protein